MKTAQTFFEDCMAPSKSAKLNETFNVSEVFFLFLSIFGEVVLLCSVVYSYEMRKGLLT